MKKIINTILEWSLLIFGFGYIFRSITYEIVQLKWWACLAIPISLLITLVFLIIAVFGAGFMAYAIKFKTIRGFWKYIKGSRE
jgi:uncharacterized protein YxeA